MRTLLSILGTKRTLARLRTRADVEALQVRRLARHLDRIARTVPFYASYYGRALAEWPKIDKETMLASFGDMNSAGVSTAQAWAAAEAGLAIANGSGRIGRLTVGTSTGTSGNRGLFLVSPAERARWLGSMLARTLPDFPARGFRVLVLLATANELYDTAARTGRLRFRFLDVRHGVIILQREIEAFRPDVVVAPPKALRAMAEESFDIRPLEMFAGGEVLDPREAEVVRRRYGVDVKQIYQATEGFLGVSCRAGTLHLNEDAVLFEFEEVSPGHVVPVVTDLLRTTQAMVRYRMNDVLVLGGPCRCGSPLRTVARIEGRIDDVLSLPAFGEPGRRVSLMPEAIRTAVIDADRSITDFRAVQTGERSLRVQVPDGTVKAVCAKVERAVATALATAGAVADLDIVAGIEVPFERKLRRVVREWREGDTREGYPGRAAEDRLA